MKYNICQSLFFVELNARKKAIGFLDVALYMWHINNWPRLEFACDQLTANEKRLFNKLSPTGVRRGCKEAFFSVGRETRQLGWFQWTPRMGSIWGVLGGQSGLSRQMALRPLEISWSISPGRKREEEMKEGESRRERERNQLAQIQALVGLLRKRNLGEVSSV